MLRSVSGMRGFTIHATDGDLGSVDEFLFDDAQWTIRYLVVNTGGWLSGRLVLVSPIAFRAGDWDRETFDVALTRQQVEQSPSIATDQPVSRQQEEEYSRYYGYPYYWDELGLWGADMYPRMAYLSAVDSTYGATATEEQVQAVIERIESCGARSHPSRGEEVTVIGAVGDREHVARLGL